MDDITLNKMYFSAIPDFYRVGIELFEIFVVSVNEQNGHRQVSQNIPRFCFITCHETTDTDISADDQIVIPAEFFFTSFEEIYYFSKIESSMGVPSNINTHRLFLLSSRIKSFLRFQA
mgnify:CR=1 FL=1